MCEQGKICRQLMMMYCYSMEVGVWNVVRLFPNGFSGSLGLGST